MASARSIGSVNRANKSYINSMCQTIRYYQLENYVSNAGIEFQTYTASLFKIYSGNFGYEVHVSMELLRLHRILLVRRQHLFHLTRRTYYKAQKVREDT